MTKRRIAAAFLGGVAMCSLAGGAGASGDYGCEPTWRLGLGEYDCAGTAMLGPRNDTRINLAWLLQRKAMAPATDPALDWRSAPLGHVFLSWETMRLSFWPGSNPIDPMDAPDVLYAGTLCQTYESGTAAFGAALARSRPVAPADAEALQQARALLKATCDGESAQPQWPVVESAAGQEFLGYLKGAQAFYAHDFARAESTFAALHDARDPWVNETARYMLGRNALAATLQAGLDEWGDFDPDKRDAAKARDARKALETYLAGPQDQTYAASAKGLLRRAYWLEGAMPGLERTYGSVLAVERERGASSPDLIEEVEHKLLFDRSADGVFATPLVLATWDLARMRETRPFVFETQPAALSAQELEQQAPVFADEPELYAFLKAAHAFHVDKDYRRALALLPDEADKPAYAPLDFSRQMLRGLALEQVDGGQAPPFWQRLAKGSAALYQRPAVELALARYWERTGKLELVFAEGSIVTVPEIRAILLEHVAGPQLLRQQARAGSSALERRVATMTLLYKDLTRGAYADFVRDHALASGAKGNDGQIGGWLDDSTRSVPLGSFASGQHKGSFACPQIVDTARTLSIKPQDPGALLCLGDFYRLNGFDWYMANEAWRSADQLGGGASFFPGRLTDRASLYAQVLASPAATPDQRAYALYRSVMCYAPSGNTSCSAHDVPEAQRKAWFEQLKREYPKSQWTVKLKYYW